MADKKSMAPKGRRKNNVKGMTKMKDNAKGMPKGSRYKGKKKK